MELPPIKNVILRSFSENDASQVKKVATSSWYYTYKDIFSNEFIEDFIKRYYNIESLKNSVKWIEKGFSKFVVAEDLENKKLIGFAQIGYDEFWNIPENSNFKDLKIFLTRIYLDPEFFRKGIGKQLLLEMEEFVIQKGQNCYYLHVHKRNKIGINFYNKNGFRLINENDFKDDLKLEIEFVKCI